MRYVNCFKPTRKNTRIEYSDAVLAAVLDPRLNIAINMNGGFDYVDRKFRFIKLLLERGQVVGIKSGSDLLACTDYMEVLHSGRTFVNVILETRIGAAYASEKRMHAARTRLYSARLAFNQQAGA